MKQNPKLNWVDSSPNFDLFIKVLFGLLVLSFILLSKCHGEISILNQ